MPVARGGRSRCRGGERLRGFLLLARFALLPSPDPTPIPGGPTAYGGTKPGPAGGGDGGVGTELATDVTEEAGADAGADVGAAPGAPTATGLPAAAGSTVWGVGAGASTGMCAASGWIAARPPKPPRPPTAAAGTINGTARTSGKA